jgi:hypothetical protein
MVKKRRRRADLFNDPKAAARAAQLRYVNATREGISRRRNGSGFSFVTSDGRPVRDRRTLERIRSLAIRAVMNESTNAARATGSTDAVDCERPSAAGTPALIASATTPVAVLGISPRPARRCALLAARVHRACCSRAIDSSG